MENHLNGCLECRHYAGKIQDVELILRAVMQKKWDRQPLPLPSGIQAPRRKTKISQDILLATRIVAMCVICMAVLINIWQFTQSSVQRSDGPAVIVPPVPTPSMQTTSTIVTTQECEQILYPVQENDTMDSIAGQFNLSRQEIINLNELSPDSSLDISMILRIPLCSSTPAGTPNTVTTLFTPLTCSDTSTPVGRPTQ